MAPDDLQRIAVLEERDAAKNDKIKALEGSVAAVAKDVALMKKHWQRAILILILAFFVILSTEDTGRAIFLDVLKAIR